MSEPYNPAEDEVIAGSEGEDEMENLLPVSISKSTGLVESIASSSNNGFAPSKMMDTSVIADFSSSNVPPKPSRPKPRPVAKKKDNLNDIPESSIATASSSKVVITPEEIDFLTPSIADRAKMRSRGAKAPAELSNDFIELSSSDDEFNLPSTKSKKNAPVKPKPKVTRRIEDISMAESNPEPPAKTKKRKKPTKQKSPIRNYDSPMTMPPTSSSNIIDPTVPIPFKLIPSQLLPPDPPTRPELPPIAVLPNSDLPPSSPSSLFSSPPPAKKRKRSQLSSLIDELDDDDPLDCMRDPDGPLPASMGPPSTFFAPSSSLSTNAGGSKSRAEKETSEGAPPQEEPSSSISDGKTKKKAKKTTKKMEMEVVIVKPAKKSKLKKKVASPETVEDDPLDQLQASAGGASLPESPSAHGEPSSDLTEDPNAGDIASSSSKKRKRTKDLEDHAQPLGENKRSKPARKRAIVSDEEESVAAVVVKTPKPKTRKRKGALAETPRPPSTSLQEPEASVSPEEGGNNSPARSPKENKPPEPVPESEPDGSRDQHIHRKNVETPQPSLPSRYTPRAKATPMSELIRRVNSMPGSQFHSPKPRTPSGLSTAYSPLLKSSRAALSRIAPLHPNRRTPPPPLPPPPPRKKTKKELEMEEKWEEELIEMAGGTTEWACMTDAERAELRRAKRDREMAGWED